MNTKFQTPLKDGYFMPAEFSAHDATLMLMPYRPDVWRNKAKEAQDVFLKIAKEIAKYSKEILMRGDEVVLSSGDIEGENNQMNRRSRRELINKVSVI